MKLERKHLRWALPLAIVIPVGAICLILSHNTELRVVTGAAVKAAQMRIKGEEMDPRHLNRARLDTKLPAIYAALQSDFKMETNFACYDNGKSIYQFKGAPTRNWPANASFDYREGTSDDGITRYSSAFMGLLSRSFNLDDEHHLLDSPDFSSDILKRLYDTPWHLNLCGKQNMNLNSLAPNESRPRLLKPNFLRAAPELSTLGAAKALSTVISEVGLDSSVQTSEILSASDKVALTPVIEDLVEQPVGLRFQFKADNAKAVELFKALRLKYLSDNHAGSLSKSQFEMKNVRYKPHFLDRYKGITNTTYQEDWIAGCHMNGLKGVAVGEENGTVTIDFLHQKTKTSNIRFDRDTGAKFDVSCS